MTIPSEKEKVYERVMEQVDNFKRYEDGDGEDGGHAGRVTLPGNEVGAFKVVAVLKGVM